MAKKMMRTLKEFTEWMTKQWVDALNRAWKQAERDERKKDKQS